MWPFNKQTSYQATKARLDNNELKNKQIKELDQNRERITKASIEMKELADEQVRDGQPKEVVMIFLTLSATLNKISAYMSMWKGLVSADFGVEQTVSMLEGNQQLIPTLNTNNIAELTCHISTTYNRIKTFVDELNSNMNYDLNLSGEMTGQCEVAYNSLLAKYGASSEMSEIPSVEGIFTSPKSTIYEP